MRFKEWTRSHPVAALASLALATLTLAIEAVDLPSGVGGVLELLWQGVSTRTGKAILTALAIAWGLWFWVVFPWLVLQSRRSMISRLCDRLDALAQPTSSHTFEMLHISIAAGDVVLKLREKSAFESNPVLEGLIDTARRQQLPVQISCKDDRAPAAMGEYQAFWIAREAAFRYIGRTGAVETTLENVVPGCKQIAVYVRSLWDLSRRSTGVRELAELAQESRPA